MFRDFSVLASANSANAPVLRVGFRGRACCHAEKRCAERREWIAVLGDRAGIAERRDAGFARPDGIVGAQRIAIGIAEQRGAVADLGRHFGGLAKSLVLRDQREPAPERFAVSGRVEAEKIGRPVAITVGPKYRLASLLRTDACSVRPIGYRTGALVSGDARGQPRRRG